MPKPKILIQLDPDEQPSTFDSVVAIDSGIDHLLRHSNVTPENITGLVHGAMFTRGPADLNHTALFFGGSNVQQSEAIFEAAKKVVFSPLRVSMLSDPNGSNTTAAAAVICAEQSTMITGKTITILGGTGPVGQRIAEIIAANHGDPKTVTNIRVCSRKLEKAQLVCDRIASVVNEFKSKNVNVVAVETGNNNEAMAAVDGASVVFSAGAAGVELLSEGWMKPGIEVAIDLNGVPPEGIHGIGVMDKAEQRNGIVCFGAIGVGGLKMKVHKRAIKTLFESNDEILGTQEVYKLAKEV